MLRAGCGVGGAFEEEVIEVVVDVTDSWLSTRGPQRGC